MQGTGHAAVVLHRKCPVRKQIRPDRLARRVKNADIKMKKLCGRSGKYYAGGGTYHQVDIDENR